MGSIFYNRKSVYPHDFDSTRKIEKEKIRQLLDYARWAPTHKMTEPWCFIVFDPDGVSTFYDRIRHIYLAEVPVDKWSASKLKRFEDRKSQVSHIIAICMHRDPQKRVPELEEICATACAAQNIYLGLHDLGLVGYWSTGLAFSKGMSNYLKLEEHDKCLGFFLLAYPKGSVETPPRGRKPLSEIVTWRTF